MSFTRRLSAAHTKSCNNCLIRLPRAISLVLIISSLTLLHGFISIWAHRTAHVSPWVTTINQSATSILISTPLALISIAALIFMDRFYLPRYARIISPNQIALIPCKNGSETLILYDTAFLLPGYQDLAIFDIVFRDSFIYRLKDNKSVQNVLLEIEYELSPHRLTALGIQFLCGDSNSRSQFYKALASDPRLHFQKLSANNCNLLPHANSLQFFDYGFRVNILKETIISPQVSASLRATTPIITIPKPHKHHQKKHI